MAVWGQAGWAYEHLTSGGELGLAVALLFAAAVESIGVYLAWEAHAALMADQAAGLLRAGSYGVGGLVGALNYWHFASAGYAPTAQAVTFGLLSAISPWLWAIRSRSMNRGRLAELDLVDVRGLKLSTSRKLWHPVRSLRLVRWAAWAGITNPATAVAGWEASVGRKANRPTPVPAAPAEPDRHADAGAPADEAAPGQEPRQDIRQAHEIESVVCAIKAAYPSWSQRKIAAVAMTSPTNVRRILGRAQALDVTHVEPANGRTTELAATVAAGKE
jgi:hypothetical protein